MKEIIKVTNLHKTYDTQIAVDNLSFTVRKGQVFGLLGANGAGKSTTLECILGTKTPTSGQVSILGYEPRKNRSVLFQKVGVQFQDTSYQAEIKVSELCEETACLYKNPADWIELCKRFDIGDKLEKSVKSLSGGERQRLFIILALIPNPEVVFLDELTTGLDVKGRRSVWNILTKLKEQGLTMVITSHFMDEVEVLCDEICILKKGQVAFHGTVDEAKKTSGCDKFEDAYLYLSGEEILV